VSSYDKTIPKQLKESFVAHSNPQYGVDAYTVFSELFGNATEHRETGIPGFAALQKYEYPKKHIQAVASDSGKGISATMNTEFNKISLLDITSFDFASFDKLRTNGINQRFLN